VLLKEEKRDADKMAKGGKRLLGEAMGLFRASQGKEV
jgi:hypothetical protein